MLSSSTPYDVEIDSSGDVHIQIEKDGVERHAQFEGLSDQSVGLSHNTKKAVEKQVKEEFNHSRPSRRFFRELLHKQDPTVTTTLIALFFVWFVLELVIVPFGFGVAIESPLWKSIFVLSSANIHYVWTWITNVFSHGGLLHLLVNSVVLGSFGYYVESELSPRKYLSLFLIGGILAGVIQALTAAFFSNEVMHIVGASGGIAAVIGCAAILFPNIRVALFFIIPMSINNGVKLFLFGSIALVLWFGIGAGQIAHMAHITGLLFGLGFGWYYKQTNTIETEFIQS